MSEPFAPHLEFDEAEHRYTIAGRVVPSVTQCLAPFINADWYTPESRHRGQCVHKAVELYELDKLDHETLADEWRPWLQCWCDFKTDLKWFTLMPEVKLVHELLFYAGQIDGFGVMDDGPATLDLKTGDPQRWHPNQIGGGYDTLIEHNAKRLGLDKVDLKHRKRRALYLAPDKKYRLRNCDTDFRNMNHERARGLFFSALKLKQWEMER